MELDSSELLKRFVAAGMGVGFAPKSTIAADLDAGNLKVMQIEGVRLVRELALVFRKDKSLSRAAQSFIEIATGRPRLTRNSTMPPAKDTTATIKAAAKSR